MSTYQDIVAEAAADLLLEGNINHHLTERRIWREIGTTDHNLADALTDCYQYEAALLLINAQTIPHTNKYFQEIVVRLAYNALTNADEFAYIVEHSKFTIKEVQRMVDLAAGAVLQHPHFKTVAFDRI